MSKDNNKQPGYEYFKALVSNMPMIFYVLDQDGVFTLSDGLGLQKLGLQPGQVVGISAFEMYKDFPDILDALRQAYTGKVVKAEHTLGTLEIENHVAPYYDSFGNIKGIVGATIDISERKVAEKELKRAVTMTEAILESVPGMLYLYNAEGKLVFWNKNHETMTGYSPEELAKMTLVSWYKNDQESLDSVQKGLEMTVGGGVGFAEANLQCKDGTRIPMYFTAKNLEIENQLFFVGTGIDLTQRKIAEEKLLELNLTLETKVKERTQELVSTNNKLSMANEELNALNQELTAMNEEIQAMNEELMDTNGKIREMQGYLVESEKMAALGNMVAGVSHEINTPVGVGVTAASHLSDLTQELLNMKKEGKLTEDLFISYLEDMDKASHIILKNLNRASRLIQSFKQLSVDQSSEPRRLFNVKNYLEEILVSLSPSLKKTSIRIELTCDESIAIDGYPGAFAQIITNLIMNSLAHAYSPDSVGIIRLAFKEEGNKILFDFSDDGSGMTEAVRSKIFDPFYTTKRGVGGSGLGLSVVYSLVTNQYKGNIICESTPEQGTIFHIVLEKGGI